ncbi:ABC transporter ATP-binding protein [Chelatococcus sp. SYSU_G07232]|uniref:ABC transporter ATP-binding protein n=2 Tax=Chelatococcus albus TaxID=3047466 RepID=A0ABT7AE32_9HYPH|nr:ABC transporter ATP-binding protein [Chelatococcus sp. SYSU_G07232]MDJ1157632.1 ABC transporter ATP-binding protein [Chelatococcus sp. SYSU_G07232]
MPTIAPAHDPRPDHLVLEGLEKRYDKVVAVAALDLAVRQGEFIALLGPSGCGKTTTLRMTAGLVPASAGRIVIGGRDVTHLPPYRRDIGLVFQNYALFPHMTVAENVAFGLEMRKVPKADIGKRVAEALALVRLAQYGERRPRELSGGQQQRVALARALVIRPSILLLDEPLSNLDAKLREEMRTEIREIQRRLGITTLFVTHDQVEALSMCDRIAVMQAGELVQLGTPFEIYERPRRAFIADFVGRSNKLDGIVREAGVIEVGPLTLRATETPARGTEVRISVRPHRIHIHPHPGSARPHARTNLLVGRVVRTTYVGDVFQYDVDVGPGVMQVEKPTAAGPQPISRGDEVELEWSVVDTLVFEDRP